MALCAAGRTLSFAGSGYAFAYPAFPAHENAHPFGWTFSSGGEGEIRSILNMRTAVYRCLKNAGISQFLDAYACLDISRPIPVVVKNVVSFQAEHRMGKWGRGVAFEVLSIPLILHHFVSNSLRLFPWPDIKVCS